jgi:hypothetical protein
MESPDALRHYSTTRRCRACCNRLPGERAPTIHALVGYGVAVRDAVAIEDLLRASGFSPAKSRAGDLFVPADAALGAAVIFRQRS